jgi:hypothetical protein
MELGPARDDLLTCGGVPGSILVQNGAPQSAELISMVVVPLLVLVNADAARSAWLKDRLPVGRIQAGAIILHPYRATAGAYSHNGGGNAVGGAADGHTVPRFPVLRLSTH